jgi:tetratricopeptide (TPR) repeat protein
MIRFLKPSHEERLVNLKAIASFVVFFATTNAATAQNTNSQQDAPGFAVESQGRKPDGREYLLANNAKNKVVLSITLEESPKGADAKTCPGYLHARAQSLASFGPTNIKYTEIAHMPVLEYFLPQVQGMPVKQQSFVACTANDNVFIDIHLSKVQFEASERRVFVEILNAVHFSNQSASGASGPTTGTNESSMDFFREGSRYFVQQEYQKAIVPYEAALELEQIKPQVSKDDWRVLVDGLGMAYGITGDLDHSEKTYQYGIGKDPEYPGFYYGMACVLAERGDMDKTMEYLRKSFSLKANVIPGESMPDPAKDDSFQRFMSDQKFRDFLKSLNAPN